MNYGNEENFKATLKALVNDEPKKLAFFDGQGYGAEIPPFIPSEDSSPIPSTERKQIQTVSRKRRYNFGMAATAACFVVFLSVAAVNSGLITQGGGAGSSAPSSSSVLSETSDTSAPAPMIPPDENAMAGGVDTSAASPPTTTPDESSPAGGADTGMTSPAATAPETADTSGNVQSAVPGSGTESDRNAYDYGSTNTGAASGSAETVTSAPYEEMAPVSGTQAPDLLPIVMLVCAAACIVLLIFLSVKRRRL